MYTWNEVNTIPVYSLYYPKGRDSHYLTDKAEVDRFLRERGDQYGGILGYVYQMCIRDRLLTTLSFG